MARRRLRVRAARAQVCATRFRYCWPGGATSNGPGGRLPRSWLFRRAEDVERDRPPDADVVAVDVLAQRVMQANRVGVLDESAFAARIDQHETADAVAQKFGGAGAVGKARAGA